MSSPSPQVIKFKRAVLKVDIEGAEHKMLAGASRLFSAIDIVMVLMEWTQNRTPKDRQFIRHFMESRGFQPHQNIDSPTKLSSDDKTWPLDIVWMKTGNPIASQGKLAGDLRLMGANHRVRVFEKASVPDKFIRATLRTPAGQATIYTYSTSDLISRSIIQQGTWELQMNSMVHEVLKQDKELQVLDLGTNLGIYALIGALMGRRVVAVDANVNNILRLRKSVMENKMQNLVSSWG